MLLTLPKFGIKQLSDHFWLHEFRCRCRHDWCAHTLVSEELLEYLEKKRAEVNLDHDIEMPIIVNSGYRCSVHNKNVGGGTLSQHLKGKAADIWIPGMNMISIAKEYCDDADGLGTYYLDNFIHVDVRGRRARWAA